MMPDKVLENNVLQKNTKNMRSTAASQLGSKSVPNSAIDNTRDGQSKLLYGCVYALDLECYSVTTLDDSWDLSLAASCLIKPAIGDTVLFALTSLDHGYIIAVLQQSNANAQSELNLPDNSQVQLNSLKITAKHLHTEGQTNLSAWQQQTEISKNYQQYSENLSLNAVNRTTKIQQHDELHANSQRIIIARDWRVRAQDTDIKASRQASFDGEQIRLG